MKITAISGTPPKAVENRGFTLIEILVVIGIIAILATIVLIAINPARQFKQARDTQRVSNVNAILNGIGQYIADNKGDIPSFIPTAPAIEIAGNANTGLCLDLVPKYIPAMPFDPSKDVVDCVTATYATGYTVVKDANDRITVCADGEITDPICVTR